MKVVVVPADSTVPCRLAEVSTLEEMQLLVGGYVEAVRVDSGRPQHPTLPPGVRRGHEATLYVNEEFHTVVGLGRNERASQFYPWNEGIWGDAFICGPATDDGHDTDVPASLIGLLVQPVPATDD
jgi:hypothetical protein